MVTGSSSSSVRYDAEAVLRPDPRRHVSRVLGWIFCWPWDLVWTLLVHNPIRELVCIVLGEIRSTLDDISRGELSDIESDFECETTRLSLQPPAAATTSAAAPQPLTAAPESLPEPPSTSAAVAATPEDAWYAMRNQKISWFSGTGSPATPARIPTNPRLPSDQPQQS